MRKHLLLYVSTITHFRNQHLLNIYFQGPVSDQNSPVRLWFPQAFRFQFIKHGSIIQKIPRSKHLLLGETVTDQ